MTENELRAFWETIKGRSLSGLEVFSLDHRGRVTSYGLMLDNGLRIVTTLDSTGTYDETEHYLGLAVDRPQPPTMRFTL